VISAWPIAPESADCLLVGCEGYTGYTGPNRDAAKQSRLTPSGHPCLARPALRQDSRATDSGGSRPKVSSYAMRGCRLSRRFLLFESYFQPRDVLLEALVVIQEAPAGQDEEIIAELRILKVDFKQPFIS